MGPQVPGMPGPAPARPQPPALAPMVSTEPAFLVPRRPVPTTGWRGWVYRWSGRRWNPGLSTVEREDLELRAAVTRPLRGNRHIAVVSRKGGVGKTTTTACLGATLAANRGDRVVALDGNPDAGNLAERVQPSDTAPTVRSLGEAAKSITSYSQMRTFTAQSGSRLEVVASDQDPEISEAFSEQDYLRVLEVLDAHYNIILSDSGTGMLHSAMNGILDRADDLVVVVGASVDAARKAGQTLDWLQAHGYGPLAANAVAVVSPVSGEVASANREGEKFDRSALIKYFQDRCRAVVEIPPDPHLGLGAEIRLEELAPETRRAYLRVAAAITERF